MKKLFLMLSLVVVVFLLGCGTKTVETPSVETVAQQALHALKTQDFQTLATLVSDNGVRFSPYEYVNPATDIILNAQEIANAPTSSASYIRGSYDGTGEPITMGIMQYIDSFVYGADFENAPEIYRNQAFERGNLINNIFDVYAGKQIVEYHFPGFDPQYGGMDRTSLHLIFDQENGEWKLIGIVHGQWTI